MINSLNHSEQRNLWHVTCDVILGGGGGGGAQYRQRTYFGSKKDLLRKFTTCDWRYYKVRQVLQSVTVITKCDSTM